MRGKRGANYTMLSLHLAQTLCEINKESLKNQPLVCGLGDEVRAEGGVHVEVVVVAVERVLVPQAGGTLQGHDSIGRILAESWLEKPL